MTYYAFSALFICFTTFILGIIVYTKNMKGAINKAFLFFAVSVIIWSLSYYFWQVSNDSGNALFFSRLLMAGAIFIPVTYLHMAFVLTYIYEKQKNFLKFSYLMFFIFLLFDLTPLFVNHVEPILSFNFWPMPGIIFHPFLVIWFSYVIYSTYLLIKYYRKAEGVIRIQLKYVIIGMIIGFASGSTNYFLWYKIPIPPIANIFGSVYVFTITYLIIRPFIDRLKMIRRI